MVLISSVFAQIFQIQKELNTFGKTIDFLQDVVQVKVDNIVQIINVNSKGHKGKFVS